MQPAGEVHVRSLVLFHPDIQVQVSCYVIKEEEVESVSKFLGSLDSNVII